MLRKNSWQKQNRGICSSSSGQGKVKQLRNQFFKKSTTDGRQSASIRPFIGIDIQNKNSYISTEEAAREPARDRRRYSHDWSHKTDDKVQKGSQHSLGKKKENRMRREFDIRVGNINKISTKIEDLLQFVKQIKNKEKPAFSANDSLQTMRARQMKIIKENFDQKQIERYPARETKQQQCQHRICHYIDAVQTLPSINQQSASANIYFKRENPRSQFEQKPFGDQAQDFQRKITGMREQITLASAQQKKSIIFQQTPTYNFYEKRSLHTRERSQILNRQSFLPMSHPKRQSVDFTTPEKLKNSEEINMTPIAQIHEQEYPPSHYAEMRIICPSSQALMEEEINQIKNRIEQSENQRRKLEQRYSQHSNRNRKKDPLKESQKIVCNSNYAPKIQHENVSYLHKVVQQIKERTKVIEFNQKVYSCQLDFPEKKRHSAILAEILGKQVIFDQKLRKARERFANVGDTEKWKALKKELESRSLSGIRIEELQEQLKISSDEHNPFENLISRSSIGCISEIADAYMTSFRFWNDQVTHCVSERTLSCENFSVMDMDLKKKNYLSIEDFVCFINLFSGSFFRNRDAIMVYRRFRKLSVRDGEICNGVSFSAFMEKVAVR